MGSARTVTTSGLFSSAAPGNAARKTAAAINGRRNLWRNKIMPGGRWFPVPLLIVGATENESGKTRSPHCVGRGKNYECEGAPALRWGGGGGEVVGMQTVPGGEGAALVNVDNATCVQWGAFPPREETVGLPTPCQPPRRQRKAGAPSHS